MIHFFDRKDRPSESTLDDPPIYAPSPSSDLIPNGPRVNHLYIIEKRIAVQAAYTVDPNLRIPPAFMVPAGRNREAMDNINLYSRFNSVHATLALVSDIPCRSSIFAGSKRSVVTVKIVSRVNQRFRLTASSKYKGVNIYLPRDFEGPVTFTTRKGSPGPIFSEGVKPFMTPFGAKEGNGRAFIGRWGEFGDDADPEAWDGDSAFMSTKYGKITVSFADEPVDDS